MNTPNPTPPRSPDGEPPDLQGHRMPGWVKGVVVAGIVVALLVVLALVVGGGSHGPARHLPDGGDATVDTPTGHVASVAHG